MRVKSLDAKRLTPKSGGYFIGGNYTLESDNALLPRIQTSGRNVGKRNKGNGCNNQEAPAGFGSAGAS